MRPIESQTPYYLYHPHILEATLAEASRWARHSNIHLRYAIKANHNPVLLTEIRKAGFGIDAVSSHEIQHSLDQGFQAELINFAGAGKRPEEIRYALEQNIAYLNVESIQEIERIQEIAECLQTTARICLRVNPNVDAQTHPHISTGTKGHKFGIDEGDLRRAFTVIKASPRVHWMGYHFHIGSQILNPQVFEELCTAVNSIHQKYAAIGWLPEIINLGGGLGVNYHEPYEDPIPDFKTYFQTIQSNLIRHRAQVHVELGRSIVARSVSLVTQVLYTKTSGDQNIAIVDAGMNNLMRPALYGAYHHIEKLGGLESETTHYDIHGPICESSDCFGRDRELPVLEPGDYLQVYHAGAYGETMASAYNLRPPIPLHIERIEELS